MAVIGKIRSYSWLILAFVGLALLAFILGDFIRKGPKGNDNIIGVVAGEKINYQEFDAFYQSQQELYKKQSGLQSIDKNTSYQMLQEVWGQKIKEIIYQNEAKKLGIGLEYPGAEGISICPEELTDLIMGKNPHQFAVQFFTQGKQPYNPSQVAQFITNLDQQEPFVKDLWLYYEKMIKEDRLVNKYNALVAKGLYVTKKDAQRNLDSRNKLATFRFVSLKYNTISDSTLKVTPEEVEKYYQDHKFDYEQETSRGIEYVMYDVQPSAEDLKYAEEDINKLKDEFAKDPKPEEFVANKTDGKAEFNFHKKGELDIAIDTLMFKAPIGTLIGPYQTENTYKLAKLMERTARPDSLKASHILFAFKGAKNADPKITRTKEQAKAKADSVVALIKKDTAKMAQLAATISDDPSAKENQGNLGWFNDGAMVPSFNNACVNGKVGDVVVTESDFGYHVIRILNKTAPIEKIKVAILERRVDASETTFNLIFSQASQFAVDIAANPESFDKKITDLKLNKRVAEYVKEVDRQLPGMESPVELVRWIYNSEKGAVSGVFDVGQKYVVAKLTQIREKGYAPLEQIKEDMELGAKREKKGIMLTDKMNTQMKGVSTIDELAAKLQLKVDTAQGLGFSAYGIPMLGAEPAVIGGVFGTAKGKISKPIIGKTGVVTVVVDDIQSVPSTETIDQTRQQMGSYLGSRAAQEVYNALSKKANIEDKRGKFY